MLPAGQFDGWRIAIDTVRGRGDVIPRFIPRMQRSVVVAR